MDMCEAPLVVSCDLQTPCFLLAGHSPSRGCRQGHARGLHLLPAASVFLTPPPLLFLGGFPLENYSGVRVWKSHLQLGVLHQTFCTGCCFPGTAT